MASEHELPDVWVKLNGEPFELSRDNTSLYTFFGALAMYNHVYIQTDPDRKGGAHIFDALNPREYDNVAKVIVDRQWPQILNCNKAYIYEMNAFEAGLTKYASAQIDEGVPDDWTTEQEE